MAKPGTAAFVLGTCLSMSGCAQTSGLFIAHDTVLGVNAAVNIQKPSGHVIIGYDRNFGTYVPKSVPAEDGSGKEAMSVLSCSELKVSDLWLTGFTEYLSTGEAAQTYAEKLAAQEWVPAFKCFVDQQTSDNNG